MPALVREKAPPAGRPQAAVDILPSSDRDFDREFSAIALCAQTTAKY
jgi:hypothetical protein